LNGTTWTDFFVSRFTSTQFIGASSCNYLSISPSSWGGILETSYDNHTIVLR
jgi:hypothetical protein